MDTTQNFRLMLTPGQKKQIRKATGKDAEVLELSVEELEERIDDGPVLEVIHDFFTMNHKTWCHP
jgi:hypothetical protein